jgi:Ferredoxin-like domain in Api92-like protein
MANMCNNSVQFIGDPIAIEQVKALFREIEQKQNESGKWQLPPYVTAPFSNMQEIVVNDDAINYQTRWYPNFNGLIQIADRFGLDFANVYSQVADSIYGEATYLNKEFIDVRLNRPNIQQIGFSR